MKFSLNLRRFILIIPAPYKKPRLILMINRE
jgi:hypothetical protein